MSKDDSSTESRWLVNNGDNWTDYKFLTMAYCGKHKCTGLLDGSLRRPVLPISTSASSDSSAADAKYLKDLEDYTTKSGNLWYYFACTHNDTTRVHIMDPGIGNDCTKAWAALCNHFESKTKASNYSNWSTKLSLNKKSDLYSVMRKFINQEVESQGWKVRRVRWDNAREQKNQKIDEWMTEIKAKSEWTSPYSSQSNGKAEKANQDIRIFSNTLRIMAKLPKKAWAECDNTACYLINRLPSRSNAGNSSPYQMLYNKLPDLGHLRAFGCKSYLHLDKSKREDKLSEHATIGTLIGYNNTTKQYRILLNHKTGEVYESRDVTFDERVPGIKGKYITEADELEGMVYYKEAEPDYKVRASPDEIPESTPITPSSPVRSNDDAS